MTARLAALVVCGLIVPLPALAHHSFSAVFDQAQTVSLDGTVTKVEWMNPHIWFYLDVQDEQGNLAEWQCEGGNPNTLVRQGWRESTLQRGDTIQVEGFRARDGTDTCNARVVILNGRRLFAGPAVER